MGSVSDKGTGAGFTCTQYFNFWRLVSIVFTVLTKTDKSNGM